MQITPFRFYHLQTPLGVCGPIPWQIKNWMQTQILTPKTRFCRRGPRHWSQRNRAMWVTGRDQMDPSQLRRLIHDDGDGWHHCPVRRTFVVLSTNYFIPSLHRFLHHYHYFSNAETELQRCSQGAIKSPAVCMVQLEMQ